MKHSFTVGAVVMLCLLASSLSAACVLTFSGRRPPGASYSEVVGGGKVICRLRGGSAADLLAGANAVAERLNEAALKGASANSVQVRAAGTDASISIADQKLLTVDAALAKLSGSTPIGLANSWAATIKGVLGRPYIALQPADELTVPVGEMRRIRYGGTAGALEEVGTDTRTVASARLNAADKSIEVTAIGVGDATVSIKRGTCAHTVRVVCRKWAARIAPSAVLQVSGVGPRNRELTDAITTAARSAIIPEPGARIVVDGPSTGGAGYAVRVSASGPDYLSVSRVQQVSIQRIQPPRHPSPLLMVSNLPEKITEPAVLMREHLYGRVSARILWHHINLASRRLRMAVRVHNPSDTTAGFHLTQVSAGPSPDEIFVGHSAAARFMKDLFEGNGHVVSMPPRTTLDIAAITLGYREVASGVGRIVPMAGDELIVEVVAEEVATPVAFFAPTPPAYSQDPQTSGYMFEGQREVQMKHVVGGEWAFYSLGKTPDVNSRGQELAGSYGVLHEVTAVVENPTDRLAITELAVRARGGVARASFWLDNALIETPMLSAATEQVIYKVSVPPGSTHTALLRTIPESGSHYPVLLTLRSILK